MRVHLKVGKQLPLEGGGHITYLPDRWYTPPDELAEEWMRLGHADPDPDDADALELHAKLFPPPPVPDEPATDAPKET